MKIGIIDNMFAALQGQLVSEGHTVKVFVSGLPKLPRKNLPAMHMDSNDEEGRGEYQQVMSFTEFWDCDMIIGADADKPGLSSYCKLMFPGKAVMYYNQDALMLEDDRVLAHALIKRHSPSDSMLKLPIIKEFTKLGEAQNYIDTCGFAIVIKKNLYSHEEAESMRTVIVKDPESYSIPIRNNWFDEKGNGGCTIEQYIEGPELCFGMWFNGEKFVGQPYVCMEHKGAWSGDMGGVLTGEVGTNLLYMPSNSNSKLLHMIESLTPLFKGKLNGMIDFNTRMVYDKETGSVSFYFMEFTMRFGRPTLECQIAAVLANDMTVGEWLYYNIKGTCPAVMAPTIVTGVVGYTYGLPIITNIIEGLNRNDIDLTSYIPSYLTSWNCDDFNAPVYTDIEHDNGSIDVQLIGMWLPLITMYDNENEAYVATKEDRHFISLGVQTFRTFNNMIHPSTLSHSLNCSIVTAYEILDGVDLKGIVWRDDVGNTFEDAVSPLLGLM